MLRIAIALAFFFNFFTAAQAASSDLTPAIEPEWENVRFLTAQCAAAYPLEGGWSPHLAAARHWCEKNKRAFAHANMVSWCDRSLHQEDLARPRKRGDHPYLVFCALRPEQQKH